MAIPTAQEAGFAVMALLLKEWAGLHLTTSEKRTLAYLHTTSQCGQKIRPKVYGSG